MRWVQSEYALKGLFLGLLLYTALQIQIPAPLPEGVSRTAEEQTRLAWEKTGRVALYMVAGLGLGLVLALLRQIRYMARAFRKPFAFFIFLLLENPLLIYLGLIGGLALGAGLEFSPGDTPDDQRPSLIVLAIGAAILGVGFGNFRNFKDANYRLGLGVAVGAVVIYYFVDVYLKSFSGMGFAVDNSPERQMLAYLILLGLPFYYLLCFVGIAEESEAEIAGLCTMLGVAIALLQFPRSYPSAGFLVPVAIYFCYVISVLPDLRVFKHTLRGYIFMEVGKLRQALLSFRRALELDPTNKLAHQGMDHLHSNIEIDKVDAGTLALLDPIRCTNRLRSLLSQKPTPEQMERVRHLLNLLETIWPKLISQVLYYRAVAAVHSGEIEKACQMLDDLLNPEGWFPDDKARQAILFDAWQLVLLVHPLLKRRVGEPQIALPGRRMEAIGAVERFLAVQPNEAGVVALRKELYENLTEAEYAGAAKESIPVDFSHNYAAEIGQAWIGNGEHWRRGAQYLRIAANGMPLRRPIIFSRIAEAYAQAGEIQQATHYMQCVRDCGLEIGLPNLPADQRAVYYGVVRRLADEAAARGDVDEAIYDYSLATNAPDSGVPTLRALAEQYEKKKDIFNAMRITEKGLVYDGRDPDLLAKKDRYYYSLEPADLAAHAKEDENVRKYFDVGYCVKKAKSVLDGKTADLDILDWVQHLVSLALVMQPKNLVALVQKARAHLRRGERQDGLTILEDVRELKPSGTEETEAWYFVQKQLGKLYLDELNRPDLAIPCFLEYAGHMGSGADTQYDLGRAYEAVGDAAKAVKHYQMVAAYEQHPLRWDAEAAIRRLKGV